MLKEEVIFENKKGYKGQLVFAKGITPSGKYFVEKRPYRNKSYRITKAEYDYIDSRKKAETLCAYYHFGVNASCDIKHPLTGKTALEAFKAYTKAHPEDYNCMGFKHCPDKTKHQTPNTTGAIEGWL